MRILWIAIAVAAAILLAGSVCVVGENQVALRFQFGRIVGSDVQPGLHFKVPLVQSVLPFDCRILTLKSDPKSYPIQDGKSVLVDGLVAWRIADVRRFYTAVGNESGAEQRLNPIVSEALKDLVARRTLQDLVALDHGKVDAGMLRQVNDVAGRSLGVQVVDIRIKRIDLPEEDNVLGAVYDRMRAERASVAKQLRAEGEEEAAKIQAEADRQRMVIDADAGRDAQQLRGEGDAQAAAVAAQAFGQDPEFYAFYRSLQSYRIMFGGKDVLVLDPDSELLRYLANPGHAAAPSK